MFDELPDSASRADLDDGALVAAIEDWTRAQATVAAHRLALVAELMFRRYTDDWDDDEQGRESWTSAAAEISAACGISHGRAESDMEVGADLCTRLPRIRALLLAGTISEYLARTIVKRTELVQDRALLAQLDAVIAERALTWGALSVKKLHAAIDLEIDRYDPGALKQTRTRVRGRGVWLGRSESGVTEIWGWVDSANAALVDGRLNALAGTVCAQDSRTLDQRRSDAMGVLGESARLRCECGSPQCPNAADDGRACNVVVHIYAEEAALTATPDPWLNGEEPLPDDQLAEKTPAQGDAESDTELHAEGYADSDAEGQSPAVDAGTEQDSEPSAATADDQPPPGATPTRSPAGLIPGFGIVPGPLLAALIDHGAKVRYIQAPAIDPETGYRPSRALDEFVRARDLTCRFPNCDRPAQFADWDHTVPYPVGPTHASGGKCLCRKHHLLKTFATGWSDVQYPDGTIVWTTPAGRTYTTKPGSSLFFPKVRTDSAPILTGTAIPNTPDKAAILPRRKRSRAKERAYRINAERALNDAHVAERNRPPPF